VDFKPFKLHHDQKSELMPSPASLLAAGGNRWDNWAASGGCEMTVQLLVEVVIIVIVIYVAVRFFRKRG